MNNLKIVRRYFRVTKADKKIAALLVLSSMLANGPYLFVSLLFSMAVARLAEGDTAGVLFLMTVYFLLKIASKVFKTTSLIVERKLYNDVYEKVQDQMVKKLDRIDMNTFTACNKGELLNIVNGDTRVLAEFGTWLSQAVLLLFSLIVSVAVLAKVSLGLMTAGLMVNALVIYILNIYNEKYERLTKEGKEKADDETRFYGELISGMKEIKIFQILNPLHEKYRRLNESYIHVHNKQIQNRVISNIVNPSITMCTEIVLMVYACWQCLHGVFGIDTVLIIQSYFGTMFTSLSDLVTSLGELRIKHVSIERYDGFLGQKEDEKEENLAVEELDDHGIRMEHLCFSYEKETIFDNYSVEVPQNTLTALAGPSGCGKSTFFHLLLRFEKPDSGRILIGGNDIGRYPREQYAGLVTCVSQQPYLFICQFMTILRWSIRILRRFGKRAGMRKLMIISCLFRMDMTRYWRKEEPIFREGREQRIAIARALLKDADVILLDEITSALDEATSAEIIRTVAKLQKNHTIMLITHKKKERELCRKYYSTCRRLAICS